jgi:hypothetical protein
MTESVYHPTLEEVLDGAVATIRDVLIPNLTDTWARASAVQLTGLLTYARCFSTDLGLAEHVTEIGSAIGSLLARYPELREPFASRHPGLYNEAGAVDTLQLASDMLVYAIRNQNSASEAIHGELRPLLVRQLGVESQRTSAMLMTFSGAMANVER